MTEAAQPETSVVRVKDSLYINGVERVRYSNGCMNDGVGREPKGCEASHDLVKVNPGAPAGWIRLHMSGIMA